MRLAWAIAIAVLVAGCGEAPADEEEDALPVKDVKPVGETGAISGVVVSETIMPVQGALITLQGSGLNTSSDENGQFVFEGLQPGVYFVAASAPDYLPTQASVEVKAGEVAKPKILLPLDPSPKPYHTTQQFNGHMVVSDYYGVYILTAELGNNALCECIFEFESDPEAQTIVLEAVWETTTPRPDHRFYWEIYNEGGYASLWSESPTLWHQGTDGYGGAVEWTVQVSSDLFPDIEQDFEGFVTFFYVADAPEGWSIVAGDS